MSLVDKVSSTVTSVVVPSSTYDTLRLIGEPPLVLSAVTIVFDDMTLLTLNTELTGLPNATTNWSVRETVRGTALF